MIDSAETSELFRACLHSLVLGVVQGLTEFLPISSTAHLRAIPILVGWKEPGVSLTAVIQLGSTTAMLVYFRSDLTNLLSGLAVAVQRGQWREPNAQLGSAVVIGTLPIFLVGLGIKFFWRENYESSPLHSLP